MRNAVVVGALMLVLVVATAASIYETPVAPRRAEVQSRQTYAVPARVLGTVQNVPIQHGGYGSALAVGPGGLEEIYLLTDRGPNVDGPKGSKVFPTPDFTPQIGVFRMNLGKLSLVNTITLKDAQGRPMNGRPNSLNPIVERDFTISGTPIAPSEDGIDSEGLVVMQDKTFWISDEYGPFLCHFAHDGRLIERVSPMGINNRGHQLPQVLMKRTPNAGLEGLTITPDQKTLVAIMEKPLSNGIHAKVAKESSPVRIVFYDLNTGKTRQLLYLMTDVDGQFGSISEIAALSNTRFLVLERDKKFANDPKAPSAIKRIYVIDTARATDVSSSKDEPQGQLVQGEPIEVLLAGKPHAEALALLKRSGIVPVCKTLLVDLLKAAPDYNHDKLEGLAVMDNGKTILISNDDDFGITHTEPPSYKITPKLNAAGKLDQCEILMLKLDREP